MRIVVAATTAKLANIDTAAAALPFKVGDRVKARHDDDVWYSGKVVKIRGQKVSVLCDDGDTLVVPPADIKTIPPRNNLPTAADLTPAQIATGQAALKLVEDAVNAAARKTDKNYEVMLRIQKAREQILRSLAEGVSDKNKLVDTALRSIGLTARSAPSSSVNFIAGKVKHNIATAIAAGASLGYNIEEYRKPGSPTAAVRSNTHRKIFINASHPFWKDPVAKQAYAHSTGHLSSDHPLHVIHHEIGHELYDPPDNFLSLTQQDLVRAQVSKYAARNPKEFVSEVHAGMAAGKVYSPEIQRLFKVFATPRK